MVDFVDTLYLSVQVYQTNGTVRDENYKGKLYFTIKYFVSFGKDYQSMYSIPTTFLK